MNIVLIGMPGCGKSTVGVLLAKTLLYDFVDTDLVIQRHYKCSLIDLINKYGIDDFKQKENDIIASLSLQKTVVATGGSAVYGISAMQNLKSTGKVIYLKVDPSEIQSRIKNIKTRGIAMKQGTTLLDLYVERAPLYEGYADIVIDCNGISAEECVNKITNCL